MSNFVVGEKRFRNYRISSITIRSTGRAKKRRAGSFRVSLRRASLLIALKNEDRE
jgi:hypothetical protein